MKVLLIYIEEPKDVYGRYSDVGSYLPPLGLATIAAILERDSHKIKIIDNSVMRWHIPQIIQKVAEFNPDCVGFSATTPMLPFTKKVAKGIKERLKEIQLVIGGSGITADKKTIWDSVIDYGVYGEGDYTFLELITNLDQKRKVDNIRGIILNTDVQRINPPRASIENLDELPIPAYHLLPKLKNYRIDPDRSIDFPIGTIVTSRGCPYNCIFCDHSTFSRKFRAHSAERVVDEMKLLVNKFGVKEIDFEDDLFIFDKQRVIKICRLLKKEKFKVKWQCTARANLIDEELVKEMASAGCWLVSIGIESGSQRILNLIKKGITIEQIIKSVMLMDKYGIKVRGYFMINNLSETKEEMAASLKLALSLPLHTIFVCITTPFPNTELWNIAKNYGSFNKDMNNIELFSDNPNFITYGFTKEEIIDFNKKFYIKFFFRPKQILKYFFWIMTLPPRQSFKLFRYYTSAGITILNI